MVGAVVAMTGLAASASSANADGFVGGGTSKLYYSNTTCLGYTAYWQFTMESDFEHPGEIYVSTNGAPAYSFTFLDEGYYLVFGGGSYQSRVVEGLYVLPISSTC